MKIEEVKCTPKNCPEGYKFVQNNDADGIAGANHVNEKDGVQLVRLNLIAETEEEQKLLDRSFWNDGLHGDIQVTAIEPDDRNSDLPKLVQLGLLYG